MQFVIVVPSIQQILPADFSSLRAAQQFANLNKVDHGRVAPRVGVVVDEFSLYVRPSSQSYFTIGGQLFAGNAVLYGFDDKGKSVDLLEIPDIGFLQNAAAVERNIALGLVFRPQITANGQVIWQWPDPQGNVR